MNEVTVGVLYAGNVGQKDKPAVIEHRCDLTSYRISVHVEQLSRAFSDVNGNRSDDRNDAGVQEHLEQGDVHFSYGADESKCRLVNLCSKQPAIRAAQPQRAHAQARKLGNQLLVDQACEDGDDDVECWTIRHPEAINKMRLDFVDVEPARNLGAAAVDDDDRDTAAVQRGDVAQRRVVGAERAAAELYYNGLVEFGHPARLPDEIATQVVYSALIFTYSSVRSQPQATADASPVPRFAPIMTSGPCSADLAAAGSTFAAAPRV